MTRLNFFLIVFLVGIISLASGTGFQTDPLLIRDNLNVDNKLIGLSNAFGQDTATLFSQTNPKLTLNSEAATPTFNPPLAKCKTTATATEGGFDVAKYVVTGDFNKDELKDNDFAFQIFSDLVEGDETEIKGDDAPYKANILTDKDKKNTKVKLEEIATVCVDTQHVVNLKKKAAINLEESDLFKSLEY
jgi:hypothetical protein